MKRENILTREKARAMLILFFGIDIPTEKQVNVYDVTEDNRYCYIEVLGEKLKMMRNVGVII